MRIAAVLTLLILFTAAFPVSAAGHGRVTPILVLGSDGAFYAYFVVENGKNAETDYRVSWKIYDSAGSEKASGELDPVTVAPGSWARMWVFEPVGVSGGDELVLDVYEETAAGWVLSDVSRARFDCVMTGIWDTTGAEPVFWLYGTEDWVIWLLVPEAGTITNVTIRANWINSDADTMTVRLRNMTGYGIISGTPLGPAVAEKNVTYTGSGDLTVDLGFSVSPGFYGLQFSGPYEFPAAHGLPGVLTDVGTRRHYYPIARVGFEASGSPGGGSGSEPGPAPPAGRERDREVLRFEEPADGETLSSPFSVLVFSMDGPPILEVDGRVWGGLDRFVPFKYWAALDLDPGDHVLRVETAHYYDEVSVTVSPEPPGPPETVKVEIKVPREGQEVGDSFAVYFVAWWDEGSHPVTSYKILLDGEVYEDKVLATAPPPDAEPPLRVADRITNLSGFLDLSGKAAVNLTVEVSNGYANATASTTVVYVPPDEKVEEDEPPWVSVSPGPTGWEVETDPDVVLVIAHAPEGDVVGKQIGVGKWRVPYPWISAQAVGETTIEAIDSSGLSTVVEASILGGASAWFDEVSGSPWLAFLGFMLLVGLVVWALRPRGRRRR